jgi:hypothetical protein
MCIHAATSACDNFPDRHATAHFTAEQHPTIQSYEPGEGW